MRATAREPFRRVAKFSLVGILGAVLQILVASVLMRVLKAPEFAVMPFAVEIVILHNFLWHERFTWRDRLAEGFHSRIGRLWRFHVANGLTSIVGNTAVVYILIQRLKFPALPSLVAAIALCSTVNFVAGEMWVFRSYLSVVKVKRPLADESVKRSPKPLLHGWSEKMQQPLLYSRGSVTESRTSAAVPTPRRRVFSQT